MPFIFLLGFPRGTPNHPPKAGAHFAQIERNNSLSLCTRKCVPRRPSDQFVESLEFRIILAVFRLPLFDSLKNPEHNVLRWKRQRVLDPASFAPDRCRDSEQLETEWS